MNQGTEVWVRLALSLAGLTVVLWRARTRPEWGRAGPALGILAALAAAGSVNFFAFHYPRFTHFGENFHYQLGSKYFPELGYDGLYQASIAAQAVSAPKLPPPRLFRDLHTNSFVPVQSADEVREEVVRRFTPERWRSFVEDHSAFLDPSYLKSLNELRLDHGYNPSPTWTFVARLFNSWLPINGTTITALALIDLLILAVTFLVVFKTYGSGIGATALLVFGTGYPWRYAWVGGGFLRYDWLAAIVIGTCMLKRRRYGTAGLLFAYAAAVRIFPVLILFGLVVAAYRDLVRGSGTRWVARFGAGVLVGGLACFLAGGLAGRGFGAWTEFARDISKHKDTWSTNRAGLELVVLTTPSTMLSRVPTAWPLPLRWARWQEVMDAAHRGRRPFYMGLVLLLLGGAATSAWVSRPDEAASIGVTAVFAGLVLTCYYWVVLLLLALRRTAFGAAAVLAANAASLVTALLTDDTQIIFAVFSWVVLLTIGALLASDLRNAIRSGWRTPDPEDGFAVATADEEGHRSGPEKGQPRHRSKSRKRAGSSGGLVPLPGLLAFVAAGAPVSPGGD